MDEIEFEPLNLNATIHLETLESLQNRVDYRKNWKWCPEKEDIDTFINKKSIQMQYANDKESFHRYLIKDSQKFFGELSWSLQTKQIFKGGPGAALVKYYYLEVSDSNAPIVEKTIIKKIVDILAEEQIKYIEVPVYEFSYNRINALKQLGLIEVGRVPKATFSRGTYWKEIRFHLKL